MSRSIDVTMTRLQMPILILSRSGKKSQVGGVDRDWLMFNIFYNRDMWGSGRRRRGLCSGCCSGRSRITRGTSMVMPRERGYSSTKVRCADQDDRHPHTLSPLGRSGDPQGPRILQSSAAQLS
jgi:hypothetical protein